MSGAAGRAAPGDHNAVMQPEDILPLIDYAFWVRDRVLAAAGSLAAEAFTQTQTVTCRDLRATLVHELEGEWAWRVRLSEGAFPRRGLDPADYPTVAVLERHWRREEREMRAWFGGLSTERLDARPPGDENVLPMWHYLVHIATHAVQQFSEAAVLLTRMGHSPGEIGYLEYATSRAGGV
jgi:uncharacterized damage-inducible protein DinB